MFYWYFPEDRLGWGQRASTVIMDENDFKYHLFFGDHAPELYDLKSDVAESKNLVTQLPEKAKELRKRLIEKMGPLYKISPKPMKKFAHMSPLIEAKLELKQDNRNQ